MLHVVLNTLVVASAFLAQPHHEQKPAPADPAAEARLLSNIRQVVADAKRSGEGYFSADGKRLIYQAEGEQDNPFYQIYIRDLPDGAARRLSPGMGKTSCAWIHPDGKRALFSSTHEDPATPQEHEEEFARRAAGQSRRYQFEYDPAFDIYEVELAGGTLTNLTKTKGYDAEASYSPDGKSICFASNRHAYAESLSEEDQKRLAEAPEYFNELYMMDADGQNVRRLTNAPGYDGGPFFSADGKRICWRRFDPSGRTAEIFTAAVDGSDVRQLTRLGAMSWAPFFHPSGDYLIFASNLEGMRNFELYLVDAAGEREPQRVTFTPGFDGLPAFSPDGKTLAWSTTRSPTGEAQIYFADWNDAAARELLGLK
jgi:Tol biopolymer transport system component